MLKKRGSLGSRLHRGSDGVWYSYAQWPTTEARERAFAGPPVDIQTGNQMAAVVAEELPDIVLESEADYFVYAEPFKA